MQGHFYSPMLPSGGGGYIQVCVCVCVCVCIQVWNLFTEAWLIYNVLVSGVQQSDSVTHIYTHILFHILFHYCLL